MKRFFRLLALAFAFMTRIPIRINFDVSEKDMADISVFFPVTSLAIGFTLSAVYFVFYSWLGILPLAIIAVLVLNVLLTGALHIDGFMDCADGFFGADTVETRLKILKDSHVGAYGVIAAVLLFLAKYMLLIEVGDYANGWFLLFMPVAGKVPLVITAYYCNYARRHGKGAGLIKHIGPKHLIVTLLLLALLLVLFAKVWGLVIFVALVVLGFLYVGIANKKLGGATGDVLGSANESGEILYLVLLLILIF